MNKFSDFAEEKFIGEKIKISKVLNKEIKVLAFQVKKSKIEKDGFYIQMQIEVDDERKVLFTNSSVLKDQLEKYKDNLPFITTIIQPKKYFHLVRRIIMYGYPKVLKTKEDYEYVRNYFPKELWKQDFQALLDTQYDWFFIDKLLKNEEVVLKKNQKIEYNEELDERYLYEYKYNPNCKLATIGYSEEEVQSILQED